MALECRGQIEEEVRAEVGALGIWRAWQGDRVELGGSLDIEIERKTGFISSIAPGAPASQKNPPKSFLIFSEHEVSPTNFWTSQYIISISFLFPLSDSWCFYPPQAPMFPYSHTFKSQTVVSLLFPDCQLGMQAKNLLHLNCEIWIKSYLLWKVTLKSELKHAQGRQSLSSITSLY